MKQNEKNVGLSTKAEDALTNAVRDVMQDYGRTIFNDDPSKAAGVVLVQSSDVARIISKLKLYLNRCAGEFYKGYRVEAVDLEAKMAGLLADAYDPEKRIFDTSKIARDIETHFMNDLINYIHKNEKVILVVRGNPARLIKDKDPDSSLADAISNIISEAYTRMFIKHGVTSNVRVVFVTEDWFPKANSHIAVIDDRYPSKKEVEEIFNVVGKEKLEYFPGLTLEELRRFSQDIKAGNLKPIIQHISNKLPNNALSVMMPTDDEGVTSNLHKTIELLDNLRKNGGKGVLLLGVPGTGKTFLAQTIASQAKIPVIRLNLASIYGSLVGESEKTIRTALSVISKFSEAFVILDEFDKSFAHGTQGQDAGTSERVISILLEWLQEKKDGKFVIAMSNHPEKFDKAPETLRRGRFDLVLGFPTPPKSYIREVAETYAKKYNLPVDEKLLSKKYLVPSDVSSFYDLASKVGLDMAHRLFKTSAETIGLEKWKQMDDAIYKMTGGVTVYSIEGDQEIGSIQEVEETTQSKLDNTAGLDF